MDDGALVLSIQGGDERAFRALFDRYHLDLYRFLIHAGAPSEIAEDILQDIFAGVWAGRSRLDSGQSIRAYLYRACRNRLVNYFRRHAGSAAEMTEEPVSTAPAQDSQLELALLRRHLETAISMLPDRRRAVFDLCFNSGLSYKEAAEVLGISPKTVENQMGYALKAVREHLSPYLDSE